MGKKGGGSSGVYVCSMCSVVVLKSPGICGGCQKTLDEIRKKGKGK